MLKEHSPVCICDSRTRARVRARACVWFFSYKGNQYSLFFVPVLVFFCCNVRNEKKHVGFGYKIAGLLVAIWRRNKWKAVIVTTNRVYFCVNSILNLSDNSEFINTTYSEKWSILL